jgi:hypothetical protein
MIEKYNLKFRENGTLIVESDKLDETIIYLNSQVQNSIEINSGRFYKLDNLDFLGFVNKLIKIKLILDGSNYKIKNLNGLNFHFNNLMSISGLDFNCFKIDIKRFINLEELYCNPSKSSLKEIVAKTRLKKLSLSNYFDIDLSFLSELVQLKYFGIGSSSSLLSLKGIGKLTELVSVRISDCKNLINLSELSQLKELKSLEVYNCKSALNLDSIKNLINIKSIDIEKSNQISNLNFCRGLINLESINFGNCGQIDSLEPLSDLPKLKKVIFWEKTNILDGNISILETRNNVELAYKKRIHYK